jgi:hypothetical protein
MMGIDGEWGDVCNISRAERRAAVFCNLITLMPSSIHRSGFRVRHTFEVKKPARYCGTSKTARRYPRQRRLFALAFAGIYLSSMCDVEVTIRHPAGDDVPQWDGTISAAWLKKPTSASAFCSQFRELFPAPQPDAASPLRVQFRGPGGHEYVVRGDDDTLHAFWKHFKFDSSLQPWCVITSSPPHQLPHQPFEGRTERSNPCALLSTSSPCFRC